MIKTKTIAVTLMAFSGHRQTIAAARRPRRTPTNGREMANQKENPSLNLGQLNLSPRYYVKDFKFDISLMREISYA